MRVSVRKALPSDVPAIARIHVDAWHQAYRGLVPDEVFATRTVERRTEQWKRILRDARESVLAACDEMNTIQGFVSASLELIDGFDSYLETLYVAPQAWGCGVGRALLGELAVTMRNDGAKSMALRTLRLGKARSFYMKLGARVVPEGLSYNDHGPFDDVILAFDDLADLTERCARSGRR